MTCPRREEVAGRTVAFAMDEDQWLQRHEGVRTCSFCGSLHPDDVFAAIERGDELVPTDKSYKIYVQPEHRKFYFQHFDDDQRRRFTDLLNQQAIKFSFPGRFYVLPFFVQRES